MPLCKLVSEKGQRLPEIPHDVYPRPMMKRGSYLSLNGEWDFGVGQNEIYDKKILLPFPPESTLSGIDNIYSEKDIRFYRRYFSLPMGFNKGKVILHFGAVDQICEVFINGEKVTSHIGGYIPFSADITQFLQEKNELKVKVWDNLSSFVLPYGKQCAKRGGMWYTPVSGIWQSVWIESVPAQFVKSLTVKTSENNVKITADGVNCGIISVNTPYGKHEYSLTNGVCEFKVENPRKWFPEDPYLYYFTLKSGEDEVSSYFALRDISIKDINGTKRICLNEQPYFLHGLLDQGYWSDGLFLPASPDMYAEEIKKLKALGFNTLRKHIKIEPQIFYYECDRLGMIVCQDMINNGEYKFFRDTVLPTVGFLSKNDKKSHENKKQRDAFLSTMKETVNLLNNHPSILYWTIFNEGWGQFDSQSAYKLLKSLDDTRIIDATSGWFKCGDSDVESEHIYFRKIKVNPSDKPIVISEFGGYALKTDQHVFNPDKAYGYAKCKSREDFVQKIRALYLEQVIPSIKNGVCGTIYTQVSDVEDEINGLFTYDRKADKLLPEEFKDVSNLLYAEIKKQSQ